ncbi:HNH endonuclease signature motif containing protein [Microbacterium capsulatum]|uniref:HNH endonuclease signature motif containing protein n=1 Tax=Microbacterium capsulatum TaxID=3041921 RepID=A0ABU0XB88_9MICO|nr:HNH endonuclease signature motif containing protein [Microbacterium sp. ASV81]MDQ4212371.1 HNH endonuclease signature motif containing protein [Microbacterium sp. ASV81]
MALFTEVDAQLKTLRALLGDAVEPADLAATMSGLDDTHIVEAITAATALIHGIERIRVVGAGITAARSTRTAGQSGLAQSRGHRNTISLVQEITGATKAEAARQVRVGEALLEQHALPSEDVDPASAAVSAAPEPWHAVLGAALLGGRLTPAQHDAIRRGLGEPPVSLDPDAPDGEQAMHDLWAMAAEQLAAAAAHDSPELLGSTARAIRDQLDPEGANRPFLERHAQRSFRLWTDPEGGKHGRIDFDDEGYLWAATIIDTALRPRRGGPRFIDPDEKDRAQALVDDPRTNDQLAYDLIMDVLLAGSVADAETVFGTRQAGVRLVRIVDDGNQHAPVAHSEDRLRVFPAAVADQRLCDSGSVTVTIDAGGNPLDVGREHRLFTSKQRVALAVRDGGCRWTGCDRPASYCEAHHIDPYSEGGRTDIDRGILLCRFHHMQLHQGRWAITRDGTGDFVLHDRSGVEHVLAPRTALAYAWPGSILRRNASLRPPERPAVIARR